MKHIIPGGRYSYVAATKKFWLSYEYYNLGVENIDSIRDLSRDILFYDARNFKRYPVTVENGCITHTYPVAGSNTDKIQIVFRTPILDSLTELTPVDGVCTVEASAKIIAIPTGNAEILNSFNEFCAGRANLATGTYDFTDDTNASTGLQNMILPWIAWYDPAGTTVYFALFTVRPTDLQFIVDSNGTITSLSLYPGSGTVSTGSITFSDLTAT
jgi:hypothetical protein